MRFTKPSPRVWLSIALVLAVAAGTATWPLWPRPIVVSAGTFPEEIVYVRSSDGIVDAGAVFAPSDSAATPLAVLWVHGWGANFYAPSYVMIGRALAERGVAALTVNTRMHDLANSATERRGRRVRGGGYWGVTSEDARDIAAWIDFAEARGFGRVVLAGHSAGWASVAAYQAERQDPRVVGMVFASGAIQPPPPPPDAALVAQASRLVADGAGDELLRLPNRSFPSYVSAATFLDIARTPATLSDFFGVQTANPGITRIHCPVLAFFGTRGDVGGESDLERLRASTTRHAKGPSRVDTVMIQGADHMYTGEETQVAEVISRWAARLTSAHASAGREVD